VNGKAQPALLIMEVETTVETTMETMVETTVETTVESTKDLAYLHVRT